MSAIVFAMPTANGGDDGNPVQTSRSNITHTWHGWDGSTWRLRQEAGVWLMPDGIRGMNAPPITHYRRTSAALNGSVHRGFIVPEREVFWPLIVGEQPGQSWVDVDAAFWATMRPDQVGTWTVSRPGGLARSLVCRFEDDGGHATTGSSFINGIAWYGIRMVAENPFWQGPVEERSWRAPEPHLFFGGDLASNPTPTEAAPDFYVSGSSNYDSATVTNPGDVEAWPVWAIDGPITSATLGVGGNTIEVPFSMVLGERLVIDTDPTEQTATLGSIPADEDADKTSLEGTLTDKTTELGTVTWAPVPADGPTDLSIETLGGGSITVQFVPLHLRAW